VSPSHTYAAAGTYTVSLTVTNTSNLTATATSKATIAVAPLSDVALTGLVYGGATPIAGAHVYLFAANTTGYGGAGLAASSSNASVSLLSAAETGTSDAVGAYVATGSNGGFSLTGDYTCSSGQQLYLYALGGGNAAAGLMAAIGSCPASGSSAITVTVNEVTTIAAAYAFAGFATDATHVSSSGTALAQVGIANAFANAANLVSLLNGTALATTPAGNGTVPQTEINTLANILAACVETSGSGSNGCALLFTNAMSGGSTGTTPTDTATAAINIAHYPEYDTNTVNLFTLSKQTASFSPALTTYTGDFNIGLSLEPTPYLTASYGIAIDGSGNAWVTNQYGNTVTEFSSSGAILSGGYGYTGGGLNAPTGIAIDGSGNVWIANGGNNSITKLSSTGSILSGASGFTGGGLNVPSGIAIDGAGNAWITNCTGGSVTELSNSGSVLSGTNGYRGGGVSAGSGPAGIAIDSSGNVWISNYIVAYITELSNSGYALSGTNGYPYGGSWLSNNSRSRNIAIDSSGNAWISGGADGDVVEISSLGVYLSGTTGYIGGPTGDTSASLALDGSGNVWDASGNGMSEFSNTGVLLSSYNPFGGYATAVDESGNVWMAGGGVVQELIGAGTPVVAPLAVGVKNNTLGTRP
jgi:PKD repeat protein